MLNNQYTSKLTRGIFPLAGIFIPLCSMVKNGVNGVTFQSPVTPKLRQMATYRKRGDSWRVEVALKGIRRSATRKSKSEAIAWAHQQESEILAGERGDIPNKVFSEALDRYAETVSTHKKGAKWELVRINLIKRDRIASVRLKDLDATHVSDWRDRRLLDVSGASVNREKNLLSHVCTIAVKEWRWLKVNPFIGVRMPPKGKPRTRLMTDEERERLSQFANTEIYKEVLRMADFAVETGMRASEICGLSQVVGKVAILPDTKNGERREVPLSDKALSLWNQGTFNMTPQRLDVHWRNLCKAAGIYGLHFHDLRHLAATRLSKKLNVLQMCRMFGWKDPRHALIYFNESAEEMAGKL